MKRQDMLVLTHLRQNARQALTKISRKTSIPVSTLHERLKHFESDYIVKYTGLLDFAKLGFNARANILVKANKDNKDALKGSLLKNPNVNSIYRINNGFDFMVEVVFRYLRDVEEFIENMEEKFKIKAKEVYYIIDDLKKEEFLADPILVDVVY